MYDKKFSNPEFIVDTIDFACSVNFIIFVIFMTFIIIICFNFGGNCVIISLNPLSNLIVRSIGGRIINGRINE